MGKGVVSGEGKMEKEKKEGNEKPIDGDSNLEGFFFWSTAHLSFSIFSLVPNR